MKNKAKSTNNDKPQNSERKDSIFQRLVSILSDYLEEDIHIESKSRLIEDLGLSSIDYLNIKVLIEGEFGIKLTYKEFSTFTTIDNVIDYLEEKEISTNG